MLGIVNLYPIFYFKNLTKEMKSNRWSVSVNIVQENYKERKNKCVKVQTLEVN